MNTEYTNTACFSGYRPQKFSFPLESNNIGYIRLQTNIHAAIMNALGRGYRRFLCGMAAGFDLICADILLDIREQNQQYHNISLTAVLPYAEHGFSGEWGALHRTVKDCANQVVITSTAYSRNCFYWRNKYLIDNASLLICYWDGKEGGTAQTIQRAKQAQLEIINLAENNISKAVTM